MDIASRTELTLPRLPALAQLRGWRPGLSSRAQPLFEKVGRSDSAGRARMPARLPHSLVAGAPLVMALYLLPPAGDPDR